MKIESASNVLKTLSFSIKHSATRNTPNRLKFCMVLTILLFMNMHISVLICHNTTRLTSPKRIVKKNCIYPWWPIFHCLCAPVLSVVLGRAFLFFVRLRCTLFFETYISTSNIVLTLKQVFILLFFVEEPIVILFHW